MGVNWGARVFPAGQVLVACRKRAGLPMNKSNPYRHFERRPSPHNKRAYLFFLCS
jgi:hypothetical protein